jgi:hypothetical protein
MMHGATTQKTDFFILTTVRTLNPFKLIICIVFCARLLISFTSTKSVAVD